MPGQLPARMIAADYAGSACGPRRDAEDADVVDSDLPVNSAVRLIMDLAIAAAAGGSLAWHCIVTMAAWT